MAFSSRIVTLPLQAGLDDALAEHVVDVQHVVVLLLRGQRRRGIGGRQEGPGRLVVGARAPGTETSSRSG